MSNAPQINTRADFDRVLAETTAVIDGLAAREPDYGVWRQIQQQLHAMRAWTANGAVPTAEQCQRVSIGLIAARELEPASAAWMEHLIARLHLLSYYWRHWMPAPAAPMPAKRPSSMNTLLLIIVGLFVAAVLLLVVDGDRKKQALGSPAGMTVRAGRYIATLIVAVEPSFRMPSLRSEASNDRYQVSLLLIPADGRGAARKIPIAGGLRHHGIGLSTRIYGDDGRRLWFYANGLAAFDLQSESLTTTADLRRLNPSLDELWMDGRYQLAQRMVVTTHDYRRAYVMDPVTLKAVPATGARVNQPWSNPSVQDQLTCGGLLSPTEWFGVHSVNEVERSFRAGSRLTTSATAEKSGMQRLFRGRIVNSEGTPRIQSMTQLSTAEYYRGALIRRDSVSPPLRLSGPDGFLLTYTSKPGLQGTLQAARVDLSGKVLWATETELIEATQILADGASVAFVGKQQPIPGKISPTVLVIIDNQSGARRSSSRLE